MIILLLIIVSAVGLIIYHNRRHGSQPAVTQTTQNVIDLSTAWEKIGLIYSEEEANKVILNGKKVDLGRKIRSYHPQLVRNSNGGFLLRVHAKMESKVMPAIKAIGVELHKAGVTKLASLKIKRTGYSGEFSIVECSQEEADIQILFESAKLFEKRGEDIIYPDFSIDKDRNISISKNILITKEQVIASLKYFNALKVGFSYLEKNIEVRESEIYLKPTTRLTPLLDKGQSLLSKSNEWLAQVNKFKIQHGEDSWFIGESEEGQYIVQPQISMPALLVVGGMGSGKTKTTQSILLDRFAKNKNIQFYSFDGKASADWVLLSNRASEYKLAIPKEGNNPLVEFSGLLDELWTEYKRRQDLFQKEGASNYQEYNKRHPEQKVKTVIFLIEEAGVLFNFLNFNETADILGSPANKLLRLMRESRSFGFGYIFLNQTATKDSIPSALAKNLTYLILRSNQQTADYFKEERVTTLNPGEFFFISEGNLVKCRNYYVGSDAEVEQLIDLVGLTLENQPTKKQYDYDKAYVSGSEKEYKDYHAAIKYCLFNKWKIEDWKNDIAGEDILGIVSRDNYKVALSFLNADELSERHIKRIAPKDAYLVALLDQNLNEKKESELEDRKAEGDFSPARVIFLTRTRWEKLAAKASKMKEENEDSGKLLLDLIIEEETTIKEQDNIKEENESDDSSSSNSTTEYKLEDELDKVQLSNKDLDRILALKSNTKKGIQFEALSAKLMLKEYPDYELFAGDKLKRSELVQSKELSGDGGVDILLKRDNDVILVQCKGYASFSVGVETIRTLEFARNVVSKKYNVLQTILITSSDLTSEAQAALAHTPQITIWAARALRERISRSEPAKQGRGRPKKDNSVLSQKERDELFSEAKKGDK